MTFTRPNGLLAGYMSGTPDALVPEIIHFGEQWAPRNMRIDSHQHNVWEFYLQVDGETVWDVAGSECIVAPGDFLAVPPSVIHHLVLSRYPKHHFYFCAVDLGSVLSALRIEDDSWKREPYILRHDAQALILPFQSLAREITLDITYRTLGMRGCLHQLIIEATRIVVTANKPSSLIPSHRVSPSRKT